MYFDQFGFFRRKRKPGDGEIEGDFDVPPEATTAETKGDVVTKM